MRWVVLANGRDEKKISPFKDLFMAADTDFMDWQRKLGQPHESLEFPVEKTSKSVPGLLNRTLKFSL